MADTITARDANHHFARILGEVEAGKEYVVTRNGVPVARIVPERLPDGRRRLTAEQERLLAESHTFLRRGWPLGIERFDRNELYDEVLGIEDPTRVRFTLDTNILVYATDGNEPVRRDLADGIIDRAMLLDCVLTPQSLAEFYQAVTRKRIIPRSVAADQVRRWLGLFPLTVGAGESALRSALQGSGSGRFQFYDALLLATAREAGCAAIISEDMANGAELDGIRVVAAFGPDGTVSAGTEALLSGACPG